ncbi:MAG: HlyC/CorC family transporter [Clostridiales bacterium]|nr:HlyC/CorC family transporter [Clostridiales bacterium]
MSGDPWGGPLILQLVLILINGWFAATEVAVLSLNEAKLRHDAEEGDAASEKLLRLSEMPNKFLSTIQVCITLAGFLGSAFAAESFAGRLAAVTHLPETLCVVLITLVLSYFTLVLGELVPKRLAMQHPEKVAKAAMGVLSVCALIFKPVVWLLSVSTNAILRLVGVDPNAETEEVTEEEIRMMVDMGGETGAIEETEKEMIENIFEFNNRTAEDVMTHRTDVTSIWVEDDNETILNTIRETGLSRFPVYDEDMDDIIGTLNTRVFLMNAIAENPKPLRELVHEAYFVPETVQADQLFRNMQMKKIHMAIVLDEYGGVSGLVTMEDLLEEIVGNIYDEFDPQAEAEITRVNDDWWRISGAAALEDVSDALDIELPLEEGFDTLGGLIFSQFTTIPQDGSQPELTAFGMNIRVEKIEDHRVEFALVSKLPEDDGEDKEEDEDTDD